MRLFRAILNGNGTIMGGRVFGNYFYFFFRGVNKTSHHHQENNRKGCNQKHKKKEYAKPKSRIAKSQIARFMRGWRVGPEQQRRGKRENTTIKN